MSHNISPVSNRLSNTSLVGHFFNRLESNLNNIGEASKELLHLLCLNIPDYSQMFEYLFVLLPDMSDGDFAELKDNLPHFLARCPEMLKEQRDLALLLCKRQLRVKPLVTGFSSYNLAMDYCAKAIQLSEKLNDPQLIREAHLTATSLILESYLKSGLFKQRIEIIRGGGNLNFFICRIIEIHQLTVFCTQDSDRNLIDIYYDQARDSIPTHYSQVERFRECRTKLEEYRRELIPLSGKIPTQEYQTTFKAWRSLFKTFLSSHIKSLEVVRVFQSQVLQQLKNVISSLLQDAFNLVGTPPCNFEIQAMGSVGREEPCPFSDLELLLLYEDSLHLSYFKDLMIIFEIQIKSLGEDSNDLSLAFTAFEEKNPSGFHLDSGGNPNRDPSLFVALNSFNTSPHQTERKRATLDTQIRASNGNPKTHDYTSLRTTTLFTWSSSPNTSASLIERYRSFSATILDATPPEGALPLRQHWALDLLKKRVTNPERDPSKSEYKGCGFIETWLVPPPLPQYHLKEQFLQLLNFVCADLALYFNINRTNTLDIVQALEEKHHLHPRTTALLSNVIAALYVLRVRIHDRAQKQTEEVKTSELSFAEIQQLERCYWLVMRPLFYTLSKVFNEKKSLDEMFNNVDLFEISFQELVSTPNARFVEPWIRHLVSYLIESNSSIQEHTSFYKRLLETPHLTNFYFQTILQSRSSESLIVLGDIPNRTGERASYHTRNQNLLSSLDKLTLFEPPKDSPIQVEIVGVNSFHKYLMPELIHQILDEKGDIKNSYPKSAHRVTGYGGLHFKQKPMHPMMEFAIHNLFYRLGGFLTPASTLVRFEVTVNRKTHLYPVLISETISGETLKEIENLKKSIPMRELGWKQWSWLILGSLLSRPGDGLLSNYVINDQDDQRKVFCIDNDIAFVEPAVQDGNSKQKTVNFCSALFCYFENEPLDKEVLKEFCSLDIDLILDAWIQDVIKQEEQYQALFSFDEQELINKEDLDKRFTSKILFREGTLATLNVQFLRLQNCIRSRLSNNIPINSHDLLRELISLHDPRNVDGSSGTYVAKIYSQACNKSAKGESRLQAIKNKSVTKSMTSSQSDIACLGKIPTLNEIENQKIYSADKAREELISTLLALCDEDITEGTVQGQKSLRVSFKKMQINGSPDHSRQSLVLEALIYMLNQQSEKYISIILNHCKVLIREKSYIYYTPFVVATGLLINRNLSEQEELSHFLHDDLELLDLRFCPLLNTSIIELISKKCKKLKELYLSNTAFKGTFHFLNFDLPDLEHLQLENDSYITSIRLNTPRLKKLILKGYISLEFVAFYNLEIFPLLEIKDCPYLDLNRVYDLLNASQIFNSLVESKLQKDPNIFPYPLPFELIEYLGKFLCKKLATDESGQFYKKFIDPLFKLVILSKEKPELATTAANAISLLNFAHVSLAGKDFRGVRIPGANLGRALLQGINFTDADLRNVILAEAQLECSQLDGADMQNVDIKPRSIWIKEKISYVHFVKDKFIVSNLNKRVFIAIENRVVMIDLETGLTIKVLEADTNKVKSIFAVREGEKLLSQNEDGTIRVWDVNRGIILKIFGNIFGELTILEESDEELSFFEVTVSGELVNWKIKDNENSLKKDKEIKLKNKNFLTFDSLVIDKGKMLATSGAFEEEKVIRLWDVNSGKTLHKLEGHSKEIRIIAELEEGKTLASGSEDKTIRIWSIKTGYLLKELKGHQADVNTFAVLERGKILVSGSLDMTIRIWDVIKGNQVKKLKGHPENIYAFAVLDGGKILLSLHDFNIRLWNLKKGNELKTFKNNTGLSETLAILPNGKILASTGGHLNIRLLNTDTGRKMKNLKGHKTGVFALASLHEGQVLATGGYDRGIWLWNIKTGKIEKILEKAVSYFRAFAVLKKEKILASINELNTVISLWDVKERKLVKNLNGHKKRLTTLATLQNDEILASASEDATIRIWNVETGTQIKEFRGHSDAVVALAELDNGKILASGSKDTTIRLWNIENEKLIHELKGHTKEINALAKLEEGKTLVSASADQTIRLWNIKTGEERATLSTTFPMRSLVSQEPDLLYGAGERGGIWCWKVNFKDAKPSFTLVWTHRPTLNCNQVEIQGIQNLSESNQRLMLAHGATSTPPTDINHPPKNSSSLSINIDEPKPKITPRIASSVDLELAVEPSLPLLEPILNNPNSSNRPLVNSYTKEKIASQLWLDANTVIDDDMVLKVNAISSYLKHESLEMKGIKADGNCFCYAYLGSLNTLTQKVPSIELSKDKISFLRKTIADHFAQSSLGSKNQDRIVQIKRDREWIVASGEGDLLAQAIGIPIRVITVNLYQGKCGVSDMMTFTDENKPRQEWNTIRPSEKPLGYITIIDLGGHFVYAQPILQTILD